MEKVVGRELSEKCFSSNRNRKHALATKGITAIDEQTKTHRKNGDLPDES